MKDFHFKTEISLFAGNVYRNVIMPVFPFSQMKPKHFSQLICPIYFRNPIRLYESHLLIYRQRLVHIPAGISDYCWSLLPDPGVPSEDASHILFFIISLHCCGSVSDRHCPSVSSSSSEIEAERFSVPPGQSSRDIELALANAFNASSCCRHRVRYPAGNRRDAFFQFTPSVHWRNWSYRTLSHNRLPAEVQASQLPQLIMSF